MGQIIKGVYQYLGPPLLYPGWNALHTFVQREPHTRVCAIIRCQGKILFVQHRGHPRCDSLPGGTVSWLFKDEPEPAAKLRQELKEELGLSNLPISGQPAEIMITPPLLPGLEWAWIGYRRLWVYLIEFAQPPPIVLNHEVVRFEWKTHEAAPWTDPYTIAVLKNFSL